MGALLRMEDNLICYKMTKIFCMRKIIFANLRGYGLMEMAQTGTKPVTFLIHFFNPDQVNYAFDQLLQMFSMAKQVR